MTYDNMMFRSDVMVFYIPRLSNIIQSREDSEYFTWQ